MEFQPLALSPGLNVTYISDLSGLELLREYFARCGGVTGWDIETTVQKDFWFRRVRTIQFGNQHEQFVIDLLPFAGSSDALDLCQGEYGLRAEVSGVNCVLEVIRPVLCNRDITKIGVNLAFEYTCMYWCFGLRTEGFYDCMVVDKVIWAGLHSLKDYAYYGMEQLMNRYFGVTIDKTLQESFTLDQPLSQSQIEYAALDTRLPIAIRVKQEVILQGDSIPDFPDEIMGDNLVWVAQIENDAIGAFQDMHLHGERLDLEKWNARVEAKKEDLSRLFHDHLDPIFIPLVGSKYHQVTQKEVDAAHAEWKQYCAVFPHDLEMKRAIRWAKRNDPTTVDGRQAHLDKVLADRKAKRDETKLVWSDMSKHYTKLKNLAATCEGEALINYDSSAQLLVVINRDFPDIVKANGKPLENLDEDVFDELAQFPVMQALKEYHSISKEISTYGDSWTMRWKTHPSKLEGWLHPMDGRLHCTFNQQDAETGRSSSSQPNAQNIPKDKAIRACFIVDPPDDEEPDGYVMVTADMSGAELRILAELAQDPVWIEAFNRKADVHCICCELMEPVLWPSLAEPGCAFYPGEKKCKCAAHNKLRDAMKPTNFGLPYGIGAYALSKQIGKTVKETEQLMAKHEKTFPAIWAHLTLSGRLAKLRMKAFDMFGRRRIFPEPTRALALDRAKKYKEEKLRLPAHIAAQQKADFIARESRKPTPYEKWELAHYKPSEGDIMGAQIGLYGGVERQGKNHEIQGTNATIAKLAMGAGYDPDGKPYLWHTLRRCKARLVKFVHDELVIQCPRRYGEEVASLIGDAFKRAGAEVMKSVSMEFEYNIETYWAKG